MDTLSEKKVAAASILMAALALGAAGTAQAHGHDGHDGHDGDRAVFVMTNDADANEVLAFQRDRYGNLDEPRHFKTGGRGSGGSTTRWRHRGR